MLAYVTAEAIVDNSKLMKKAYSAVSIGLPAQALAQISVGEDRSYPAFSGLSAPAKSIKWKRDL